VQFSCQLLLSSLFALLDPCQPLHPLSFLLFDLAVLLLDLKLNLPLLLLLLPLPLGFTLSLLPLLQLARLGQLILLLQLLHQLFLFAHFFLPFSHLLLLRLLPQLFLPPVHFLLLFELDHTLLLLPFLFESPLVGALFLVGAAIGALGEGSFSSLVLLWARRRDFRSLALDVLCLPELFPLLVEVLVGASMGAF
jgi:hypothetical protein